MLSAVNRLTIVVDGQEDAASGFEVDPIVVSDSDSRSLSIVATSVIAAETIGEDDKTLNGHIIDGQFSVEETVTSTGVQEVVPLCSGEGAPETSSVAAIGDDVVAPIVDASQIIGTREVAVGTTLIPDGVSVASVTSEVVVANVVAVSTPANQVTVTIAIS